MNPKPKTRNVALIRRVLLEELVEERVTLLVENQVPEVLYDVLRCATLQQRIAKRLHVRLPESSHLVGRIVSAAYIREVKARKGA